MRKLAKQSALNARAKDDAVYVIESIAFEAPKTKQMVALLDKVGLGGKKVLVLTAENNRELFLSARNLHNVFVMEYVNASAYEILWSDALIIEESALTVHDAPPTPSARERRLDKVVSGGTAKQSAGSAGESHA